ncbi:copper resistance system multicopper oxidase [Salinisphaera sp. LB1]|uniref:copper resistance system multicopper oxidase n=1 Tax=Salinisphaera sp. LB1 TaxID=2183911 RepID=UPI000D70819F|nr:copper resistance system multicopper oxidase [Salinisphaera sp. LB1]AWN14463.1 Multicopper oxidase [Salinisphaera sp. LB1]
MNDRTLNSERRRLLQAMAAGGMLAGLDMFLPGVSRAAAVRTAGQAARVKGGMPRSVTRDFHIRSERIEIAGGQATANTVDHGVPGPLLELWQGHNARLRVHNHLSSSITSLHWHGLLLPFELDGVPGVSFPGVAAGDTFEAYFPVRQSGTYWYHSHAGFQEQIGQLGPIVIHPAEPEANPADREYVVVLTDWTFENPARLFAKLKESSDYYNFHQRTLIDLIDEVERQGLTETLKTRLAWNKMRMSPRDIADVTGHTYTYLMNGQHPAANWTGLFTAGERIKLRVINASSMTYFNFRIPGLPMTVVAADGQKIDPVDTDEFQIAVAETYDVIVKPHADTAYTIMAESMDRSGYTRGTLAPRPGMTAAVPALRPPPTRTMVDMGMPMKNMAMDKNMSDQSMAMAGGHSSSAGGEKTTTVMGAEPAMGDMHGAHGSARGMSDSGKAAGGSSPAMADMGMDNSGPVIAQHGPSTHGVGNVNVAEAERYRLADRPTGLADVAHRVLTYSQLRNIVVPPDTREPSKTIEVHLTGNMDRYMWSFDGREYSQAKPIEFPYRDRIRLILVNDTMMEHPIHLHGMFMELENHQGEHRPYKHTISVLPGSRVSLLVTANEPGRWAFHCHLLYHMEAGMFRVVRVAPASEMTHA